MRAQAARAGRRILCVFPRYTSSFGTFEYSYPLTAGVKAFMPPQGLLLIAAYLPEAWDVRFIDENIAAASEDDFRWAEAVLVSGMHVQRAQLNDICRRAHEFDLPVAIGGPSVSASPEYYPSFDYLHIGELGDATDELIALLARDVRRPPRQVVLETAERLPMTQFPVPAYELAQIPRYFLGSIQYSSGCPYQCEFCDIPALYGRNPRLKTPEQVTGELDKLLACGLIGSVYFVDDNFIGNRKAALELLPHLIAWQKRTGFVLRFSCEATLNIAKRPEILEKMREAYFITIFCGIETPDPVALKAIAKDHNMMVPIMEAVATLNRYGLEVVSGIILGLDTDKPETGEHLLHFIDESQIPLLTINLLQALPKTPLWDRLRREHRLVEDDDRDSNVRFLMPYADVVAMWQRCMGEAYQPRKLFERYEHQVRFTYANRITPEYRRSRLTWPNVKLGATILKNIFWNVGVLGDYRGEFWKFAARRLMRGQIEHLVAVSLVAHHLILYARIASRGRANASHYSMRQREALPAAAE